MMKKKTELTTNTANEEDIAATFTCFESPSDNVFSVLAEMVSNLIVNLTSRYTRLQCQHFVSPLHLTSLGLGSHSPLLIQYVVLGPTRGQERYFLFLFQSRDYYVCYQVSSLSCDLILNANTSSAAS